MNRHAEPWLHGFVNDHLRTDGVDLLSRWTAHRDWWDGRSAVHADPYGKSTDATIAPVLTAADRAGRRYSGVNLASQDHLNLASHARVHQAAMRAIVRHGVHSAGSVASMGNTADGLALEQELAAMLALADATVFPSGWAAAYGSVKTLVRPTDHVVIDQLAHAGLQEGAREATSNLHPFRHLSNEGLDSKLRRIRTAEPDAGILVVTESLFGLDSEVPDLRVAQYLARQYRATLLVDVAQDLGVIGADGMGHLGLQGALGGVDVVVGSFSHALASHGGFAATHHPALKLALMHHCSPLASVDALSPMAAAVVRESLRIIQSDEGAERRARMLSNSLALRHGLEAAGFAVLGVPSATVPVLLGDAPLARLMTKHVLALGGIVNLVEHPTVSRNTCRWCLQVMADHTRENMHSFVRMAVAARELALAELGRDQEAA